MPTHPYWERIEAGLFQRLAVARVRARAHGLTLRTHGRDTQPKIFTVWRKARLDEYVDQGENRARVLRSLPNSMDKIEAYLDQLDAGLIHV
jgi:hypothetical protein